MQSEITRLLTAHHAEVTHWLRRDISAMCSILTEVANGDHNIATVTDAFYDNVDAIHDDLMQMLFGNAYNSQLIPDDFWLTDIGQTMLKVTIWLNHDELITLTEAAQLARGATNKRDLIWINDQIKRDRLTRF